MRDIGTVVPCEIVLAADISLYSKSQILLKPLAGHWPA